MEQAPKILQKAGTNSIPEAEEAVFVVTTGISSKKITYYLLRLSVSKSRYIGYIRTLMFI
jgi:hypothetical protein